VGIQRGGETTLGALYDYNRPSHLNTLESSHEPPIQTGSHVRGEAIVNQVTEHSSIIYYH